MKKLLILLIVGTLLICVPGVFSISIDKINTKTSMITFSQPSIKIEGEFVTINLDEANAYLMEKGKPMLPTHIEIYAFPFKTKIKSVTCTPNEVKTLKITKDIKPSPKAVIVGESVTTSQKEPINYGTKPYPSNWFIYNVGCGLYYGELSVIVKVEFNPVKYYPSEKIIEWAKEANIVIQYEEPAEQPTVREQYKLVIIAPDEYSDALAPLITHKIERGISTKFAGLTEVYNGTGFDNQEKIKYYIKDAIENWGTSNILLVGSYAKLPSRYTHVHVDANPQDYEQFVSDLYYADIYDANGSFCSWDSNDNGVYGEYNYSNHKFDEVDLFPDVYLGRLPCRTVSEVTTVVNKIINYENNQAYLQNWFKNLVVCGGDSFPDDANISEGEYNNQIVVDMMDGFTATKLWASNGELTSWVPTGVQNIEDAINIGCGFVDFCGHGNTNVWATHPHLDFNTWIPPPTGGFISAQVQTLANGDGLPIVTVEACDTARFDIDPNCFNWAFMYNPNGGAIGTFGATALGWFYTGSDANLGILGKLGLDTYRAYKLNGSITFGEMWAKALNRYITGCIDNQDLEYKTVEEWEPFGDPTLQIAPEPGAPNKPVKPSGPTSGVPSKEYTYTSSTTDPKNDNIYYMFDWGDGTNSSWVGPFISGATASAKHIWNSKNTYLIKVQAKNTHDKLSEWSDPLSITMPRSKIIVNSLLTELTNRFNNIFPILQKLLNSLEQ